MKLVYIRMYSSLISSKLFCLLVSGNLSFGQHLYVYICLVVFLDSDVCITPLHAQVGGLYIPVTAMKPYNFVLLALRFKGLVWVSFCQCEMVKL